MFERITNKDMGDSERLQIVSYKFRLEEGKLSQELISLIAINHYIYPIVGYDNGYVYVRLFGKLEFLCECLKEYDSRMNL